MHRVRTFGCVRNEVLDWRIRRYRVDGVCTSYAESDRHLTWLKKRPDLAFLNEVSSVPLQQTLRHRKGTPFSVRQRSRNPSP
jgi:putative transposase